MKDLGHTTEGNPIVEMTRDEYSEFVRLREAVEGASYGDPFRMDHGKFEFGFDFSKVFEVIRVYYTKRFMLNHFQELLNAMQFSLQEKKE